MAVTNLASDQLQDGYRAVPTENHGKVRYQYFSFNQGAVAGDANSTIDMVWLPSGRVRLLPFLSYVECSAFGASRVMSIGHYPYENPDLNDSGAALVPVNASAFATGLDLSAAADKQFASKLKFDMYSRAGIKVFGTVTGGTIPAAATLVGLIAYICE